MNENNPHPMNEEALNKFVKAYDFAGLAAAFAKGNVQWHEKEWRTCIESIRSARDKEILETIENRPAEARTMGWDACEMDFIRSLLEKK